MPKKIQFSEEVIQTALFAKALSHPVRVFIIKKLLKMGTCCYSGDIVEEIPVGRSSLSQHLKELKMAGLIQGETDPPFIKYCLNRDNWAIAKKIFTHLLED